MGFVITFVQLRFTFNTEYYYTYGNLMRVNWLYDCNSHVCVGLATGGDRVGLELRAIYSYA